MQVTPIAAFNDNYIWAIRIDRHLVVVDPGDAAPVIAYLQQHQLQLDAILITHHHADHTAGIDELCRYAGQPLPIYGPANEPIAALSQPLYGGETISPGHLDNAFSVISVPGHTKGHIAYYCHPYLFCGDTLFSGGCGRIFEGSPTQMYQSLQQLKALPADTLIFPAHEYTQSNLAFALAAEPDNPAITRRLRQVKQLLAKDEASLPASLAEELTFNPFLRTEQAAIQQQLSEHFGVSIENPQHAFTLLRQWKDHF